MVYSSETALRERSAASQNSPFTSPIAHTLYYLSMCILYARVTVTCQSKVCPLQEAKPAASIVDNAHAGAKHTEQPIIKLKPIAQPYGSFQTLP